MKRSRVAAAIAAIVLFSTAVAISIADAQEGGLASRTEVALLGGVQVLNENDTAFPDNYVNIPAVAALSYYLTPNLAVEGEFTWMIPLEQTVSLASGQSVDRKSPDILAYQANVRAHWPVAVQWSPYLTAGAGALTILSNTDADRLPQVDESETMFALNFGAGVSYGLTESWALRADFREFVAFPSDQASGLSNGSEADEIWIERGTVGIAYRF